jgi:hypothetical protein
MMALRRSPISSRPAHRPGAHGIRTLLVASAQHLETTLPLRDRIETSPRELIFACSSKGERIAQTCMGGRDGCLRIDGGFRPVRTRRAGRSGISPAAAAAAGIRPRTAAATARLRPAAAPPLLRRRDAARATPGLPRIPAAATALLM